MPPQEEWPPAGLGADDILDGVSTLFESLGRALVCLNRNFQIVHASKGLDRIVGHGAAETIIGRPVESVFGNELFGAEGSLRRALLAGDRREGWGATLQIEGFKPHLVSISTAPVIHTDSGVCDPRVSYVIIARPIQQDYQAGSAVPTLFSGLVARSASMLRIFGLIEHLAESDATVLITGESGTGKELVARAVHVHSPRSKGPFVAVNSGALPQELLESELFGHVRGAFTGAVRDRVGRFELASGGTIFLDEVGDIPVHLQVRLLRVLQEKTFERVGESESRTSDARVIAATNKDLRQAILDESFREDLYYRLRVVPIEVPPLRKRREDIEPLAGHLLARVGARHDRSVRLSPEAMRALLRYSWPGNVRELENALEYAVAVSKTQTLHPQDLPLEVSGASPLPVTATRPFRPVTEAEPPETAQPQPAIATTLDRDPEVARIRSALEEHQWRRTEAAAALGMSRTTLWRKMREHGLLK